MNRKMFLGYPLNLQLFAEPGEGGGDPGNTDPNPSGGESAGAEIDYDKLAETIEKRIKSTENSTLKGYLKDKGLSKEEIEEAVKSYRANKEQKTKDEQERIQKIIDENLSYKKAEADRILKNEAKKVAKELGVRDDRFDALYRLSDTSHFLNDDKVDSSEIKKEFETQLKAFPEFKQGKKIIITAGNNGYQGNLHETTDEEEYRRRKYGKNKYFKG